MKRLSVHVLTVPCPQCKSPRGKVCREAAAGTPLFVPRVGGPHEERVQKARKFMVEDGQIIDRDQRLEEEEGYERNYRSQTRDPVRPPARTGLRGKYRCPGSD